MVRKEVALKRPGIVFALKNYGNFDNCLSYEELLPKLAEKNNGIFEYVHGDKAVIPYFDIDIKGDVMELITKQGVNSIQKLKEEFKNKFPYSDHKFYVMTSHSEVVGGNCKFSAHVVVRIVNSKLELLVWESVKHFKDYIVTEGLQKIIGIDMSVYRDKGGLFRCINASKPNENRPLVYDEKLSNVPLYNELETLIHYLNTNPTTLKYNPNTGEIKPYVPSSKITTTIVDEINSNYLPKSFVQAFLPPLIQNFLPNVVFDRTINVDFQYQKYKIYFKGVCPIAKRRHKSNNMVLYIATKRIHARCLDVDCGLLKSINLDDNSMVKYIFFGDFVPNYILSTTLKELDPGVSKLKILQNIFFQNLQIH